MDTSYKFGVLPGEGVNTGGRRKSPRSRIRTAPKYNYPKFKGKIKYPKARKSRD